MKTDALYSYVDNTSQKCPSMKNIGWHSINFGCQIVRINIFHLKKCIKILGD